VSPRSCGGVVLSEGASMRARGLRSCSPFRAGRATPPGGGLAVPDRKDAVRMETDRDLWLLACAECPRLSVGAARGWRAYRSDDPDVDDEPALTFYCPSCAEREFDGT
jgi:hypothetical protein